MFPLKRVLILAVQAPHNPTGIGARPQLIPYQAPLFSCRRRGHDQFAAVAERRQPLAQHIDRAVGVELGAMGRPCVDLIPERDRRRHRPQARGAAGPARVEGAALKRNLTERQPLVRREPDARAQGWRLKYQRFQFLTDEPPQRRERRLHEKDRRRRPVHVIARHQ